MASRDHKGRVRPSIPSDGPPTSTCDVPQPVVAAPCGRPRYPRSMIVASAVTAPLVSSRYVKTRLK